MIRYYRHNDGYIAVTDKSPAGFEGLIFVGRGGPIDHISEQLYSKDVLTDPVDVHDVEPSWVSALGYHTVEDVPLLDEEGDDLVAEIPVREPVEEVEEWADGERVNPGWVLGLIAGAIVYALIAPYL